MDWQSIIALIVMNWLGIFSLIATIVIGYVTIRYRNKQHQINGLLDAFRILNTRGASNIQKEGLRFIPSI